MKLERYSNESKMFQEITTSKLQGQQAGQFNFYRYEGLCLGTKAENHCEGLPQFFLQNFRTATF